MESFHGRLETGDGEYTVTVTVDSEWIRIGSGSRKVGAWNLSDVRVDRPSVFRFTLATQDTTFTFRPEDPAAFAAAVPVVVDLRPKSRFGLGDRVKAAKAEMSASAAGRTGEAVRS